MKVSVSVRMYTLERAYCQLGIVIGRKVLAQPIRDQSNFYKILLWGLLSCSGYCCHIVGVVVMLWGLLSIVQPEGGGDLAGKSQHSVS